MMSSVCWLSIVLLPTLIISRSIQLTPNNPSTDGATIIMLKNVTTNSNPIEWQISPSDDIGFHLQLSLDNTWRFVSSETTKITLQIAFNNNNVQSNKLLVSFSQSNMQYLTIFDDFIYPECDHDNTTPYTQSYGNGNIESIVSMNSTDSRLSKATNNTPLQTNETNIGSPLTFILENHPISNYTLFTYSNPNINMPISCGYIEMIDNISMDIYLAAIDIGNVFNIQYINITQQIYDDVITTTPSPTDAVLVIAGDTTTKSIANGINTTFIIKDTVSNTISKEMVSIEIIGKSDDVMLIILTSMMVIGVILSILDIIHSKLKNGLCRCCGIHRSDQMNYSSIFLFILSICNIMTDLYISYEACLYFLHSDGYVEILILDLCSFIFIVVPYCINILSMAKIFNLKCKTKGPTYWFDQHFIFFAFLEFISCDSYLSVKLIKSHIFGMNLFNSGHSSIELKKIRSTKIATICTQNIPQIVIQLIFGILIDNMSNILIVSMVISSITSIPFLIIWTLGTANDRLSHWKEYNIEVILLEPSHGDRSKRNGQVSISNDIFHETSQIRRYCGHKMLLHRTLSDVLGVTWSKLEIGYIEVSEQLNGCKIHIIHKVASMDRDISKLYDGKYEKLSKALKEMYHISLEWGLFCTLSGMDDIDEIHEKELMKLKGPNQISTITQPMNENNNENNNGNHIKKVSIMVNTPNSPQIDGNQPDEDTDGIKPDDISVPMIATSGGNTEIDYDEEMVNKILEEKKHELMDNNINNMNEIRMKGQSILSEGPKRNRNDTEVSDLFGVGGNDDNPFGIPIMINNINHHNKAIQNVVNVMDIVSTAGMQYEEDESTD